jgi:DNA transposition AAA+ family ATPase
MKNVETTSWQLPDLSRPFSDGPGRSAGDFAEYCALLPRVIEAAERNGWTRSATAASIGMPESSFSMWASKTYHVGRYDKMNALVKRWLEGIEEAEAITASIPSPPAFIQTEFSISVMDMLAAAQLLPGLVMVNADAGQGKTFTGRRFAATRARVHFFTMSPQSRSVQGMLTEMAAELGVGGGREGLTRAIGNRVRRVEPGTLLIIDEAQNLQNEAMNQLRHFLDVYGCGIALMGNSETYARYSNVWTEGAHLGQLKRRVFMRMKPKPLSGKDVRSFIKAWGVTEKDQEDFLFAIAQKPGALGHVNETMRLAGIVAKGSGAALTLKSLKAAWENRGVEA